MGKEPVTLFAILREGPVIKSRLCLFADRDAKVKAEIRPPRIANIVP